MSPTARSFKEFLKESIKNHPKDAWGKDKLILFIEETYSEFVEQYLGG